MPKQSKTKATMKKILLSSMIATSLLALTACGDTKYTQADMDKVKKELSQYKTAYTQVSQQLKASTQMVSRSSLVDVTGAGNYEFQTIDSRIKFPSALTLQGSNIDSNQTLVRVGSQFIFTPSNNWIVQLNGTTVNFAHPAKIWGTVKAITANYDQAPNAEFYRQNIQNFYRGFPKTNIVYKRLFLGDTVRGMISTANITVDKKPHVINAGVVYRNGFGILFIFDYEDNKQGTQQELLDLLLSSASISGEQLKIE